MFSSPPHPRRRFWREPQAARPSSACAAPRATRPAPALWALWLALALAACGNDPASSSAADTAAGDALQAQDALSSDITSSDATGGDAAGDATGQPDSGPAVADKPLASVDPPAWVTPTGWTAAVHYAGTADAIGAAIADGSFVPPKAGTKAYGKVWLDATPKSGVMGPFGNGNATVWLIGNVNVPKDTAAIARLDRVSSIRVGAWRAPGDIYGHGKARVPLRLKKGDNLLIVRGRGGQKIRVTLETSDAELHLNPLDWTRPELRVGHKDPSWLGVPLLELTGAAQSGVRCRVMESPHWKGTEVALPGVAPLGLTHASFRLEPKAAWTQQQADDKTPIPVTLRVESLDSDKAYEHQVTLSVVPADAKFRQTFRSPVDRSVQFYGVVPPSDFDPSKTYAVALSLHGAGVEAKGQANSYSPKDWMYVVAATNRRRFGFDWEEWGHLNGLATLADATERFGLDPLRTYVTGHSMGGHGTWQFGIHHADLFAVVGPSAGWDSFYTYGGSKKPTGPFLRPRASSDTSKYISNLGNRAVYVIHGTADNNVPWSEGQAMRNKAAQVTPEVQHHWEQGAGHWWNGDKSKGADCVDWPPLFALMKTKTLDPVELSFSYTTPGPWHADRYSYARVRSAASPLQDCKLVSAFDGATLVLDTTNVRTLEIDVKALKSKGLSKITIDGKVHDLSQHKDDAPLVLGPTTGKRPGVHGPFNQVMHTPWCWVWPDDKPAYGAYASYLSSTWAIIGNGQGCAVPASRLTAKIEADYNLVHLGRTPEEAGAPAFARWDKGGAQLGDKVFSGAAMQLIWDTGTRLHAAIVAPEGQESLLWMVIPFSSRSGMPDFLVWKGSGLVAAGSFDADWKLDPALAAGL